MRTRISAIVLAAACVLAACGSDEPSGAAGAGTGSTPDTEVLSFTAPTVDDSTLEVGSLTGTDVAIWFWAPW